MDEGSLEATVRERDREIEELRAKLDDQMRMVTALRSSARKRDMLEKRKSPLSDDTARPPTANGATVLSRADSQASIRSARPPMSSGHRSNPSTASRSSTGVINFSKTPLSPMAILTTPDSSAAADVNKESEARPVKKSRRKSVDEMTMLLDQMIQERVESGQVVHGERGSLRVKRDTVMEKDVETGAENVEGHVNGEGKGLKV